MLPNLETLKSRNAPKLENFEHACHIGPTLAPIFIRSDKLLCRSYRIPTPVVYIISWRNPFPVVFCATGKRGRMEYKIQDSLGYSLSYATLASSQYAIAILALFPASFDFVIQSQQGVSLRLYSKFCAFIVRRNLLYCSLTVAT